MLGPQVALNTGYQLTLSLRQILSRNIIVDLLQGQIATNGGALCGWSILIMVEIAIFGWREHHVIAVLYGLVSAILVTPHHHRGVLRQVSCDHLVPSHELASVLVEELSHAGYEISLQVIHACGAQLAHLALTQRTRRPRFLCCLIATHMNVMRGEHIHHLLQDILKEVVCGNASSAIVGLLMLLVRA